jgi:predicted nucleic acid-binding protein
LADPRTVYWDSCVWIGHIQQEPDKFPLTQFVMEEARAGRIKIVTSAFALAEVIKRQCDGQSKGLPQDEDDAFAELLKAEYITVVNADWDAGLKARDLFRQFRDKGLKKPQDALHLATAVIENVDEMHTFDGDDLLKLNGLVTRSDGQSLKICLPPEPPAPPTDLFSRVAVDDELPTIQ